ncbi:MAG: methyltransferase domain-containing protein [Pseudomonadota bacterium]
MSETYIFTTGEKAVERLEFQKQLGLDWSFEHLQKAGIREGMTVVDMGCGVGAMTAELAKLVGDSGIVYAFDISEKQLEIARAKTESEGLKNVIFICGDIYSNNDIPINTVDLIYMRYLLMHIKSPDLAITGLKKLLKSDGVIASQESIISSFTLIPDCMNVYLELGRQRGVDYDLGKRSVSLYQDAGFSKVDVEYKQLKIPGSDMKKLVKLGINEWKDKALEAGIINQDQLESWQTQINNFSGEIEYPLATQAYVLAWN